MQQTNCNTHNKARIPATISKQVYDYCITTSLQQVHNRMILYGNQALEVNKLALNSQDDKRITIDGIASYTIGHHRVWGIE